MQIVRGNLLHMAEQGQFDIVVHGCNCFCVMGAGVAGQIASHPIFNKAYDEDKKTISGDWNKLGSISYVDIVVPIKVDYQYSATTKANVAYVNSKTVRIINAYTQYNFGHGKQVEYLAIKQCMEAIRVRTSKSLAIGMPKIGCGLGGGDWEIIEDIISHVLCDHNVTIVEYTNER